MKKVDFSLTSYKAKWFLTIVNESKTYSKAEIQSNDWIRNFQNISYFRINNHCEDSCLEINKI